jgi:hypothetical protein
LLHQHRHRSIQETILDPPYLRYGLAEVPLRRVGTVDHVEQGQADLDVGVDDERGGLPYIADRGALILEQERRGWRWREREGDLDEGGVGFEEV